MKKQKDGYIKITVPDEYAHLNNLGAIKISGNYLKFKTGLYEGCLAIYSSEQFQRGDLAAVEELGTGEISIGFIDRDFGLVYLERPFLNIGQMEPLLLSESEVKVLGKIIGYCDEKEGIVKPIVIAPDPPEDELPKLSFIPFE